MHGLTIRPYAPEDQAAVVQLLVHCQPFDRVDSQVFMELVLDDPDFDPALNLVGTLNGQVVGFAAGAPANERLQCPAGVKVFTVASHVRRQGIGTRLFDELEARLRERGATRCVAIAAGNHRLAQGVDVRYTPALCFLLGRGYTRVGVTQDMSVELAGADLDTTAAEHVAAAGGARVRRASVEDRAWLREGIERELASPRPGEALGRRWAYLALRALGRQPPTVHVAEEPATGEFLGFAACHAARLGALGPMGVAERARGLGLGTILLKRCLRDLRDEGYREADIYSVGPICFYAKTVGARISRVLYQLAKPLQA